MPITLKDLPGPKGYPLVGNLPLLDLPLLHQQIEGWADEYGEVFRLFLGYTSQTVVTKPSMIQEILHARPEEFIRQRKMDRVIRGGGVHGVFNAEGEDWKLHRKIVARGLDVRHQREFYPAMLVTLERLYRKWMKNAESGEPFDIQRDLLRFTVDVTSTLAFGKEMNTLEQEGGAIQDHMEKVFPMIFRRINMPIQWHKLFRRKDDREFDRAVSEMNTLVNEFIANGQERLRQHPELRENPGNLLEAILVAGEEEEQVTEEQIRGNLLTLLMAGEDTTAHTLAWLLYLLTIHTEIQEGIRKEVDRVLGDDPWVKVYEKNAELKYLEAVTWESMRFKPVAPINLLEATQDVEVEGHLFTKGQRILIQWRAAALRDANFSNARDFDPTRWMKESRCPVHNTDAFAPFGGGPRYCPGRNLALLEIRMVLSMLFRNFEIEMLTPHDGISERLAFTMMADPYQVRLRKRNVPARQGK